jgi:hypothetical protein
LLFPFRQLSFDGEKELHRMTPYEGFKCKLCPLVVGSLHQLQAHLAEHSYTDGAVYSCYLCNSVFLNVLGLESHMLKHRPTSQLYECSRCEQKFVFAHELERHIRSCVPPAEEASANKGKLNSKPTYIAEF